MYSTNSDHVFESLKTGKELTLKNILIETKLGWLDKGATTAVLSHFIVSIFVFFKNRF